MVPLITITDPRANRIFGHPSGVAMYNMTSGLHSKEFRNFGTWLANHVLPMFEGPEGSSMHLLRRTSEKQMLSHYISALQTADRGIRTTYLGEDFDPESLKKGRFAPELLPLATPLPDVTNAFFDRGSGRLFNTTLGDFNSTDFQLPMANIEGQMIVLPLLSHNELRGVWSLFGPSLRLLGSELSGTEMVQQTIAVLSAVARTVSDKLSQGIDALTGVMTRSEYPRHIMNMIKLAREGVIPDVSAIMIDLDHFKNYNDRYGHSGGDTVLSTAAGVFLDHIRRKTSVVENERRIAFDAREFVQDVVGRAGGEEFIVVLPVCLEEAALVAERLRIALGSTRIDLPNVPEPQFVTGSFGVASLKTAVCIAESQNADMEQLLSIVDTAMYTSKNEGRNRVTVHRPCTSS